MGMGMQGYARVCKGMQASGATRERTVSVVAFPRGGVAQPLDHPLRTGSAAGSTSGSAAGSTARLAQTQARRLAHAGRRSTRCFGRRLCGSCQRPAVGIAQSGRPLHLASRNRRPCGLQNLQLPRGEGRRLGDLAGTWCFPAGSVTRCLLAAAMPLHARQRRAEPS